MINAPDPAIEALPVSRQDRLRLQNNIDADIALADTLLSSTLKKRVFALMDAKGEDAGKHFLTQLPVPFTSKYGSADPKRHLPRLLIIEHPKLNRRSPESFASARVEIMSQAFSEKSDSYPKLLVLHQDLVALRELIHQLCERALELSA